MDGSMSHEEIIEYKVKNSRVQDAFSVLKQVIPYDLSKIIAVWCVIRNESGALGTAAYDAEDNSTIISIAYGAFEIHNEDNMCMINHGFYYGFNRDKMMFILLHEIAHHLINCGQIDTMGLDNEEIACNVFASMILMQHIQAEDETPEQLVSDVREYMSGLNMYDEYEKKIKMKMKKETKQWQR